MPEYPDQTSGITGAEASDPLQTILNEHREGLHSGRRRRNECPHCHETATDVRTRAAWVSRYYGNGVVPPWFLAEHDGTVVGAREWGSSTPPREKPEPVDAREPVIGDNTVSPLEEDLRMEWRRLSRAEENRVVPKAIEYGAADLDIMGHVLGQSLALSPSDGYAWTKQDEQELACAFYALGKVARAFGAYAQGRMPNDDCWHDLGVYARMVQIIRARGGWMK